MHLPHAAFQVLSPDTDRRKEAHLLGPSRGAGTVRRCLLQACPTLPPAPGFPAAWQPAVKDAAFQVSVCPASFGAAALCPPSPERQNRSNTQSCFKTKLHHSCMGLEAGAVRRNAAWTQE